MTCNRIAFGRRSAIGFLGAAAALVSVSRFRKVTAHGGTPVPGSVHPLVGTWLMTPADGMVLTTFGTDGSFISVIATNSLNLTLAVKNQGLALGHWEPIGDHSAHFSAIQVFIDNDGTYVGSRTFEGHPVLIEDHQRFMDESPQHVVIRDAANVVIDDQLVPVVPPIVATRIGASPDSLVFPDSMLPPTLWP